MISFNTYLLLLVLAILLVYLVPGTMVPGTDHNGTGYWAIWYLVLFLWHRGTFYLSPSSLPQWPKSTWGPFSFSFVNKAMLLKIACSMDLLPVYRLSFSNRKERGKREARKKKTKEKKEERKDRLVTNVHPN